MELHDLVCITDSDVLERVDEYTLYCHYLEFEPELQRAMLSPLPSRAKADINPSFSIYQCRVPGAEYRWKDSGNGETGDIFKLIQLLFGYESRSQAVNKVKADFGLGGIHDGSEKVVRYIPKVPPNYNFRIKSKPFTDRDQSYWMQFNITLPILQHYNTTAISCYWKTDDQQFPNYPRGGYAYAYRIFDKYQVYCPFASDRKDKFRTNWTEICVPGFEQIRDEQKCDTLIITKAYKDVMMFASFNQDAVAPRGENMPLPIEFMRWAEGHYKRIVVWQDNDGKTSARKYYPDYRILENPQGTAKDPSDYCKKYGVGNTLELINYMVYGNRT